MATKRRAFPGRNVFLVLLFFALGPGGVASSALAASASRAFQNDFVRVTITEGLSQGTGFSILQDRQGFIWIATEDGLNRYDGNNFRIYRPTDDQTSISNTQSNVLFEDSRGVLWIGTSSGLNRYNRDLDSFTRFVSDPNDPQGTVKRAKEAVRTRKTIRELVIEKGIFSRADLDEILSPRELTEPGVAGGFRFEPTMPEGYERPTGPTGAGG